MVKIADVKWIKIVTDIFDDQKIRFIETMPNGDGIVVIWFKLLCLAGKSNNNGFLMMTDKIAYTDDMLASIFNRDIKLIQLSLETFQRLDMIEITDNKIYLTNWSKHQNVTGLEEMKEKNRLRQQKYREKQKLLTDENVTSQVTSQVTLPSISISYSNSISNKDNKGEYEGEKKKKKTAFETYAAEQPDLLLALNEFEKMRKSIKKPLSERAKKLLLTELDKLASDTNAKIAIINQSIMHCWQTVYPLKDVKSQKQTEKEAPPPKEGEYW